ncbi:hypothetical protein [Luteolibacter soli]|uniref:Uncharacterized protein n=1 Tax=Luteolibacter soli TaxID=3135280 RepID=A0ABU9AWU6_9BACT
MAGWIWDMIGAHAVTVDGAGCWWDVAAGWGVGRRQVLPRLVSGRRVKVAGEMNRRVRVLISIR